MAANNTLMVIGRVGKDPEARTIASGRTVTKFSIAVRRPGKDAKGQEVTDWFSVDLWGKQAELAGDLIRKGALISVAGACNIDTWTDNSGIKQTMVKIAADSFQLLENKRQDEARDARISEVVADFDHANHFNEDDIPPF